MHELDRLLNEPESPKQAEPVIQKPKAKPTATANKASLLAEQDNTIAAASTGSRIYRSAKDFLEAAPAVKGYKK